MTDLKFKIKPTMNQELLYELRTALDANPDMSIVEIIYFCDKNRSRNWKLTNRDILTNVRRLNELRLGKQY